MIRMDYQKTITEHGLRVFPLNGKIPPEGFHWTEQASLEPVASKSYGIACDEKITVLDADTYDFAVWWYKNRPITDWMVRTRKGVHFIYKGESSNRQCGDFDVRGNGGYIVGVGSIVNETRYELVKGCRITLDLPEWNEEWLPEEKRVARKPLEKVVEPNEDIIVRIKRARGYLRNVISVSGSGSGDKELFRAASALIQKFDIPEAVALEELRRWNETNAKPPWSEKRLRYKIEEALKVLQQ